MAQLGDSHRSRRQDHHRRDLCAMSFARRGRGARPGRYSWRRRNPNQAGRRDGGCCTAISRPRGAVIKHSAASPKTAATHRPRRGVRIRRRHDAAGRRSRARSDRRRRAGAAQIAGPKGAPGHAGGKVICRSPKKTRARAGRQRTWCGSPTRGMRPGTAFGTNRAAHHPRKSAVGGPLALVKNGDMIRLDVSKAQHRSSGRAMPSSKKRRAALAPVSDPGLGERRRLTAHLFNETILQADEGLRLRFHARAKGKG